MIIPWKIVTVNAWVFLEMSNGQIERSGNKYTIKYAGNDDIIDIDDPKLVSAQ